MTFSSLYGTEVYVYEESICVINFDLDPSKLPVQTYLHQKGILNVMGAYRKPYTIILW